MTRLLLIGLVAVALAGCAQGEIDTNILNGRVLTLPPGANVHITRHAVLGWWVSVEDSDTAGMPRRSTHFHAGTFENALNQEVAYYLRVKKLSRQIKDCAGANP